MTHADWVAAKGADAPPALVSRVQGVLGENKAWASLPVAEALVKAGEHLLAAVLDDGAAGREVALDLLAADACVTWAFEAAANDPGSLSTDAERAMQQIADLAK